MSALTILRGDAERAVIEDVRRRIAELKPAGDIGRWEKGWQENLDAYRKSGDVADLRPKYIRGKQPLRFGGKFVIAEDPDYEWHWYEKFREKIASKWLADCDHILEFGCGSCHNIAWLAQRYPDKEIWGFDWAEASIAIAELLRRKHSMNIWGARFDFFAPTTSTVISQAHSTAVLTIGALEQTGRLWRPFLDFLLREKPARVVHLEPIVEFYDHASEVDRTAIEAHHKRGFWTGYLDALLKLQDEGRIKMLHEERTGFGSLMVEGYSVLAWQPL